MRNVTVALIVVIGILGGFYSGWKYSQGKVAETPAAATTTVSGSGLGGGGGVSLAGPSGASGPSGAGGRGAGGAFGGAAAAGTVVSLSGNVLTVHDRTSNKDVKVNLAAGTPISKTAQGSSADLTPGTAVTVIGSTATDGSVDARAITIGGGNRAPGG